MLADHPDVFARLRNEALETLGPKGKVSPENLREMKYLRAVLNFSKIVQASPRVPSRTIFFVCFWLDFG